MLSRNTIAAGCIAIAALAAAPANAGGLTVEFGYGGPSYTGPGFGGPDYYDPDTVRHRGPNRGYDRLSPREVRWLLQNHGYRNINFLDRHGPVYRVRAVRRHNAYLLVVSARSGDILDRQRLNRGWY
ncbi:MAG: hypothetical protein ACRED5_20780 [Propylenella sp.]